MPATMSWATYRTSSAPTIWKVPELSTSTGYAAISPGSASCSSSIAAQVWASQECRGCGHCCHRPSARERVGSPFALGVTGSALVAAIVSTCQINRASGSLDLTAEQAPFFYGAYFVSLGLAACWP